MTKSLTEQWKDGELPEGTYYVMFLCGRYGTYEFEKFKGFGFDNDLAYIKEVLAPVPSYEEYQGLLSDNLALDEAKEINAELEYKVDKLEQQLAIATKALKELEQKSDKYYGEWSMTEQLDFIKAKCTETLYEIEKLGVK